MMGTIPGTPGKARVPTSAPTGKMRCSPSISTNTGGCFIGQTRNFLLKAKKRIFKLA